MGAGRIRRLSRQVQHLSRSPCGDLKTLPPLKMASTLPTTGTQGPVLFEDLAVYFSQEECVSLHPAQRSCSRDTPQECLEDMALMGGEGKIEINQKLRLESMGLEELALEKYSIAVPLVYYPENSSEHGVGNLERKMSGLAQHQKTHAAKKACGKYFGQKTNLALPEKRHGSASQHPCSPSGKCFGQPSHLALPERGHEDNPEHCSDCGENLLSFSKFEPLKCPECSMTFLCISELISHQSIHRGEKPHKCKPCAESFISYSELACHQKNHTGEPFKCTVCGKSFRLKTHLIVHQQTHAQNTTSTVETLCSILEDYAKPPQEIRKISFTKTLIYT
eukprot:bmy_02770T0